MQVVLTLSELTNAVVVPTQAMQTGQNGEYIYVVKPDQTIEERPVTAGITYQGETVVTRGLKAGETVVTDGQLRLAPGVKVNIKSAISSTNATPIMKMKKHPTTNIQQPTSNESVSTVWVFNDGDNGNRKYDLEVRLLEFASAVIDLSEQLPDSRAGNHVAGQILRSGTSPYPNHGEAEDAESREDFIHKLKVCLKELRETRRWARLIQRKGWVKDKTALLFILSEADELIRIFLSSIQTARRNLLNERRTREAG